MHTHTRARARTHTQARRAQAAAGATDEEGRVAAAAVLLARFFGEMGRHGQASAMYQVDSV